MSNKEEYNGIKFRVIFENPTPPDHPLIPQLALWCGYFHRLGLAPPYPGGSYGNLSFRTGQESFIITGTCIGLKDKLTNDSFVEVRCTDVASGLVWVRGTRNPSSESLMHAGIYRCRHDVTAVFHGHAPLLIEKADVSGLAVTASEYPYGTPELADAVSGMALSHDFFIIRNHGFISLGTNPEDAGQLAVQMTKGYTPPV